MTSLVLTCIDALLHLAVAVAALLVVRRLPPRGGVQRHSWQAMAFIFMVYSVTDVVQVTFGSITYAAGPESAVWPVYMRWMPIFNHSRTLVMWSLYGVLAVLAAGGERAWPVLRYAYAPFALGMFACGALLGYAEGSFDMVKHLSYISMMDAGGFMALATLLFVTMLRDSVDRALWFALLAYGCHSVVSSLFLAALTWSSTKGVWTPPMAMMEMIRVIFTSAMLAMVVWRLRLARRGVSLPGLLGTTRPAPALMT
jgi:hypothetical protein